MNPKEKFSTTIKGENLHTPIFCPAIYDYKVNFSNTLLNLFGQTEGELVDAIEKEIQLLKAEVVTCGYDIYNIEAEALGAIVNREETDFFPDISKALISNLGELEKLPVLKKTGGRMPVFINAAKELSRRFGDMVYIRGAVSGPFSLAGTIYQNDRLIMDCMINPQGVYQLLDYCTDVILTYIRGFLEVGEDVVLFDSLASPPLISPEIYGDLIFPFHERIFEFLKNAGVENRPLIMGGNTLPIMDQLTKTGANQLLLDYVIPLNDMGAVLDQYNMAFRINIDPGLVACNDQIQIAIQIKKVFEFLGHRSNLLIGTGILAKETPLENIQFIKEFITEHYHNLI